MKAAALAAAAAAGRSDTRNTPAHSLLRAAGSAGGGLAGQDAEALTQAAARVAASGSHFAGSLGASGRGVAAGTRALPHPGIRTVYTAGSADGASLGGLGAEVGAPSVLSSGPAQVRGGLKRPRGAALGAPVALASGEVAPLVSGGPRGDSSAAAPRGWFDLPAPKLTTELKRELTILRNRNFLDPARRYKTSREDRDQLPKYFQIGTVVDGATERRGSTRAQRKPSMLAALQADPVFTEYATRTMENIRKRAEGGGIAAYRAKKAAAGAAWKKQLKGYKSNKAGRATTLYCERERRGGAGVVCEK